MTTAEVEQLVEDFVAAAERCERAGFDGVELHGAHDYVLCEFLNGSFNLRNDRYGGSLENRMRVLLEIVDGIRRRCRPDFHLAVRLSPERFGMATADVVATYQRLVADGQVDMIDVSMWDVFKDAVDPEFEGRPLLEVFAGLERGDVRLGVAGKLYGGDDVQRALDGGGDLVVIGRAAITNHDFPELVRQDPHARMRELPVPRAVLHQEGLSEEFIGYMSAWQGFVGE
jgi:2,4-dienoyl-CoA reductase-like NADH-dependent reductase (Old Yellow Enzyme family)